ncbi:uncharacterized protein LOC130748261 [Lotus japonicus]|uniref:uncharacterized protein LOC130748261 n=1 Tax=Lotus japonicus TaxID=34305 RepID=UPI002590B891|nr:uncharacterized protein LOC130748261 [Lotus japonicus]
MSSSCKTINLIPSSTTSSASLARRYRFKRAILVGKKQGGCSTPAPMWKTRTGSPPSTVAQAHHHHREHFTKAALASSGSREKELSVSARKLAATLWEIIDLPPSRVKKESMRSRGKAKPRVADPDSSSYSPFSKSIKGFEVDGCRRRVSALSHSHQLHFADYYLRGQGGDLVEKVGNKARNKKNCCVCSVHGVKNRLKEARSDLSTSKKLLKVLSQMCLQEQHSSSIPLIMAMSTELDRVHNQVDQLIEEQSSNQSGIIEHLMKHFAEEKISWKRMAQEKIGDATKRIVEELEVEKKLRRQSERLNEKIAREMANVKSSYLKVSKELEREKRAKEILEQICDELAKGIGEDKAQVEEMKRELARVREEVEKEREMLQLADVLREERVQMKLSEAKYQFEEKNAALEKLRNELESFFRSKEEKVDINPEFRKIKDLEAYLNKAFSGFQNLEEENENDSGESDLQSIELNMDCDNKSFKWSYVCDNVVQEYDAKRVSFEKDVGRRSFSERIQWGSICFNKKRDIIKNIQQNCDQLNEETESYSYKPAQRSGQFRTLQQYIDGEAGENTLALEGLNLKQEAEQSKMKEF